MDNNSGTTAFVAWLGLILAIVALILAWSAFNRAGQDVSAMVEQQVDEATIELRTNFQELQTNYEQLERDVRDETAETLRDAAQDAETDEQ